MPPPPAYLTYIQVVTALISFLSSTIMASSIAWFGIEGSTPYRRIILGLSLSDIIQSLAVLMGPLAMPLSKMSWEVENEVASCRADGFFLQVGATAVMLHTVFLCFYYVCKLKYRMSDDAFKYRFERKIRVFIVLFCLIPGVVSLAMDAFHVNHLFSFCLMTTTPTRCRMEPQVVGSCDEILQERITVLNWIFTYGYFALSFSGIMVTMVLLCQHAHKQNKNIELEVSVPTSLRSNNRTNQEEENVRNDCEVDAQEDEETNTPQGRLQKLSRLYQREMSIQATLYVGALCFMYFPLAVCFMVPEPPASLLVITMTFFPLGGFLNILVYTRPKVASLRRTHPECSRIRGFWMVLHAGGEIPDEIDLSVSFCDGCCRPPAWLESEYEYASGNQNMSSFGIRFSSIGF